MQKYNGALGHFTYKEDQFRLNRDVDGKRYLEYIGQETDGAKISVPKGLVDGTGMFQDKPITSQPKLPDTLRIADCMFAGCENLKGTGTFPAGLIQADYMYACCPSLETVEALPEGLSSAQGMFDNCTSLKEAPRLPENLQNMKYMFWSCPGMEQPELPEGVAPEEVYSTGFSLVTDDLSDLPDTTLLQDTPSSLAALFGRAEEMASDQRPRYQVETEEPVKMSQQERDNLLATLEIDGLESQLDGLGMEL